MATDTPTDAPTEAVAGENTAAATNPDEAVNTAAEGTDGVTTEGAATESTTTEEVAYADFTLPEGFELDAGILDKASPVFKEMGLSKDQAQKFIDLHAEHLQASQQKQTESFEQLKQGWAEAAKNDPEIGGEHFNENVAHARAALTKFGSPELTTLLNDFGVGNNPEVIKFMAKVGRLTAEDTPGNGSATAPSKSRLDILYPSDSK